VLIALQVRRFRCRYPCCPAVTFAGQAEGDQPLRPARRAGDAAAGRHRPGAGWAGRRPAILAGIYEPGPDGRRPPECLYGSVKMWEHLNRQGITVAKCTVERLMRAHGWRGVTRGRTVRTTVPDLGHSRAPDLVKRHFQAARPGQLHVADFTYVPLEAAGSSMPRSSLTRSPGRSPGGSARCPSRPRSWSGRSGRPRRGGPGRGIRWAAARSITPIMPRLALSRGTMVWPGRPWLADHSSA
jgi:hypothetical protein